MLKNCISADLYKTVPVQMVIDLSNRIMKRRLHLYRSTAAKYAFINTSHFVLFLQKLFNSGNDPT